MMAATTKQPQATNGGYSKAVMWIGTIAVTIMLTLLMSQGDMVEDVKADSAFKASVGVRLTNIETDIRDIKDLLEKR